MFRHGRIRHLPPSCRFGGVPVHHDPVHGIVPNPGNREWAQRPLSFFVVWDNPVHRVLVNWDPPISQVVDLPGTIQNCITVPLYRVILIRRRTVYTVSLLVPAPYILYEGGSHVLCMGGNVGYIVSPRRTCPPSSFSQEGAAGSPAWYTRIRAWAIIPKCRTRLGPGRI